MMEVIIFAIKGCLTLNESLSASSYVSLGCVVKDK